MTPLNAENYPKTLKKEVTQAYYFPGAYTETLYENRLSTQETIGSLATTSFSTLSYVLDSVGLLPPAYVWRKLEDYSQYELDLEQAVPPTWETTEIKSLKKTFNHVHYYALGEGGFGYFKPKNQKHNQWYPFYIPGKATEIYCDGANFAVVILKNQGDQRILTIYTKKVLKEWREKETGEYQYIDLTQKDNWRESWFNFPGFSQIKNLPFLKLAFSFCGDLHLIKPEKGTLAFSHRGPKHSYYRDQAGRKHYDNHGVSQMLWFNEENAYVASADPWLLGGFSCKYELPDHFKVLGGDASASSIFLIGTSQLDQAESVLKLYLRMIDFDIRGDNPFYKAVGWYTHEPDSDNQEKIALPPADWQEILLPEESECNALSKYVGISQIGEGNDSRLLTICGKNVKNTSGYFKKKLTDEDWFFVETPDDELDESELIFSECHLNG